MVHIRDLSYDVLDGIMSHLAERPGDLITASLVSRSFWLAVVPIMYQTIVFDEYLAQKYPKVRISVVSPPLRRVRLRGSDAGANSLQRVVFFLFRHYHPFAL